MSRLEAAKKEIAVLVSSKPENRYSLFALSDTAKTVIPPTDDPESFLLLLRGYRPGRDESPSTDLRSSLSKIPIG